MNLKLQTLWILLWYSGQIWSQDVHFSQFGETPLWRNPSLAGLFLGDIRLQGVYKSQWQSVSTPYITTSLNGEYKMPIGRLNDFLTIGAQVINDKAGITNFKTTHILPVINYHKSLNDQKNRYLSLGFMAGLVNRSIDRSKITTNSQYDGSGYNPLLDINEPAANYSLLYGDASVGLSYNSSIRNSEYDNFFIGVAYHHFNRPNNAFYRNPGFELRPKWVYSAGVRTAISPQAYLTVLGDYSRQGSYTETIFGGMLGYAIDDYDFNKSTINFHAGAYMRLNDAIIPIIKLDYLPFSAAISYDINVSPLKTYSRNQGGFEFSLSYIKMLDRENGSMNAVRCPRF